MTKDVSFVKIVEMAAFIAKSAVLYLMLRFDASIDFDCHLVVSNACLLYTSPSPRD